jgi:hypothetical protein
VQTVAMVAAVVQGKLPTPDLILFADTSRERTSTGDYMEEVIDPALESVGLKKVQTAGHELATVDLYAHNGDLLVPGFTETGKLPTFCSNEWKQRVIMRKLRELGLTAVDVWIGFSTDEAKRAKPSTTKWYQRRFPLLELGMNRADCLALIEEMGWPRPMKSSCWMCPNMSDTEWAEMKEHYPQDFASAVELEKEFIEWDGITLHRSGKPIDQVEFSDDPNMAQGNIQCSLGYCWV